MKTTTILTLSAALSLAALGSAPAGDLPLALEGKCAVCLGAKNELVDGKPEFTSDYDAKTYRFPSAEQKRMFDADPARFVPALGGDCTVCLVEMGKRVPGKAEHALVHEDRLYLFPGQEQLDMFKQDPDKYKDADLALGGACPVCLVKLDEVVEGLPQLAVVHDGLRYLFPGEEQKRMFLRDPAAYTPALGGDCTVCKVEMNQQVAGKPEHHLTHDGRLYLFPERKQLEMFEQDPHKYANVDLALDGNCAVCKVDMKKDVPGQAEFAVDYRGQRYLFPDAALREKFLRSPSKYAVQ
jgi:YHS domain-containing protein